jgi:hypothetical protein
MGDDGQTGGKFWPELKAEDLRTPEADSRVREVLRQKERRTLMPVGSRCSNCVSWTENAGSPTRGGQVVGLGDCATHKDRRPAMGRCDDWTGYCQRCAGFGQVGGCRVCGREV